MSGRGERWLMGERQHLHGWAKQLGGQLGHIECGGAHVRRGGVRGTFGMSQWGGKLHVQVRLGEGGLGSTSLARRGVSSVVQ